MILLQILSVVLSAITSFIVIKFVKKESTVSTLLKVFAAILFVVLFIRLMTKSNPDCDVSNAKEYITYITNIFNGRYNGEILRREAFLMVILSFFGIMAFCSAFTGALIDSKGTRVINIFYIPVVLILYMVFFGTIIKGTIGFDERYKILHSAYLSIIIVCLSTLYSLFVKRELIYKDKSRILSKNNTMNIILAALLLILVLSG